MFKLVVCIVLVMVTSSFGANVTIVVHPALQGYKYLDPPGVDHPVITSATHNSQQLMEQLEVTNYSTKEVVEVKYGWRIAGSAKCTAHHFPAKWGVKEEKVVIPPGKAVALFPSQPLTTNAYLHQLIDEADLANAHVVVVTIGILKVDYADGTSWEDKEAGPKNMFDGGTAEILQSCDLAPSASSSSVPSTRPRCQNVSYKLKDVFWSSPLDECWPTPARGCTGRMILAGDCPFQDCVIVGCGYDCSLTWTVCWGTIWPLNCNAVGGG